MAALSDSKIEIAKELILKTFYFLEKDYYYTPVCKEPPIDVFLERFEVEYVHEIKRRKVRISYSKGKVYEDIKYTFTASITRLPDSGWEDMFSLWVYLGSIGKDFNASIINYFDEEGAESILKKIAEALKAYALDIIEGKIWLETYYPRKD